MPNLSRDSSSELFRSFLALLNALEKRQGHRQSEWHPQALFVLICCTFWLGVGVLLTLISGGQLVLADLRRPLTLERRYYLIRPHATVGGGVWVRQLCKASADFT